MIGTAVGEDLYYPTNIQTFSDGLSTIVPGQTRYFRVKIKNTGSQATIFSLNVPTRPAGWTTTILSTTGTLVTNVSTWNTPSVAAGGYSENIIKVVTSVVTPAQNSYAMNVRAISSTNQDQVNALQTLLNASTSPLDLSIKTVQASAFMGEGVINITGDNQQVTFEGLPGTAMEFAAKLQNLTGSAASYHLTAPAGTGGWTVAYYDATNQNITTAITGSGGWALNLSANAAATIRIVVTAPATIPTPPTFNALLQATVDGDAVSADAVKATSLVSNNVAPNLSVRLLSDIDTNALWRGESVTGLNGTQTWDDQKLYNVIMGGETSHYLVHLNNPSTTTQAFKLDLPAAPNGWSAQLFQNLATEYSGGDAITFDPQTSGPTLSIPGNGNLELRLDIASIPNVATDYEAKLRATVSAQLLDQVSVLPQIQKIASLEWSDSGDEGDWHPFDAQHKPEIDQMATIGIRANKSIPTVEWPQPRAMGPKWTWQGVALEGDVLWLQGKNVTAVLGESVTAEYGNNVSGAIRVLPVYDTTLAISQSVVLAGAGPTPLKTITLSARIVDDETDAPQEGVKVHFRGFTASNPLSGEVGTSIPADDTVLTNAQGIATAVWTSSTDLREIKIEAMPIDERGNVRGTGDTVSVVAGVPYAIVTYGDWTLTGGVWSRVVAVHTSFQGQNVPGRTVTIISTVGDRQTGAQLSGWNSLGAATGTTDADGNLTTVQHWNPAVAGALPDNYKIELSASLS